MPDMLSEHAKILPAHKSQAYETKQGEQESGQPHFHAPQQGRAPVLKAETDH